MNKKLMALGLLVALTGCGVAQVDPDVQAPAADKSIVVIGVPVKGVYPDEAKLYFWPADIEHDGVRKASGNAVIVAAPASGYIVSEVDAGTPLVLADVYVNHDKEHAAHVSSSGTSHFKGGGGAKTVVFPVPGGQVIYVGNVVLDVTLPGPQDFRDGTLRLSSTDNFDAAKAYVDSHYPGLRGKLVAQPFQVKPLWLSTAETVTIFPMVQSALNPAWTWAD